MTIETAIEVILNDNDLEVTPYMVSRLVDRFEFSDEQITVPEILYAYWEIND